MITVFNNELQLSQEITDTLLELKEYQKLKKEMVDKEKAVKEAILEAMEKYEVKSFENEAVKLTYKEAFTRPTVDTDLLKAQGLYDDFTKNSLVKSSLTVKWLD